MDISPINQPSAEVLYSIFDFAEDPAVRTVCTLWNEIDDRRYSILFPKIKELGPYSLSPINEGESHFSHTKRSLESIVKSQNWPLSKKIRLKDKTPVSALAIIQETEAETVCEFYRLVHEKFHDTFDPIPKEFTENLFAQADFCRSQLTKKAGSINHLNLAGSGLKQIPKEISLFSNLQNLNLNHNDVSSLPDSIGNLSNLRTLELYDNNLTALPDNIRNLSNLQELNLTFNKLTTLPDCRGLSGLQWANLYNAAMPYEAKFLKARGCLVYL